MVMCITKVFSTQFGDAQQVMETLSAPVTAKVC